MMQKISAIDVAVAECQELTECRRCRMPLAGRAHDLDRESRAVAIDRDVDRVGRSLTMVVGRLYGEIVRLRRTARCELLHIGFSGRPALRSGPRLLQGR